MALEKTNIFSLTPFTPLMQSPRMWCLHKHQHSLAHLGDLSWMVSACPTSILTLLLSQAPVLPAQSRGRQLPTSPTAIRDHYPVKDLSPQDPISTSSKNKTGLLLPQITCILPHQDLNGFICCPAKLTGNLTCLLDEERTLNPYKNLF